MTETILYLEDDESLAFVTGRALSRRGFRVLHFADIAMLRAALPQCVFDYAVLDLKIGNESSLGVLAEIKRRCDVPVVVLSGYGTIRTAVQAMKLGAVDFLSKPCSLDELLITLKSCDKIPEGTASTPPPSPSLKNIEWEAIHKAIEDNQGNISAAARQLKMHRRTLQRKLQKRQVNLDGPDED